MNIKPNHEVVVRLNDSKNTMTVYLLSDGFDKKVMDIDYSGSIESDPFSTQIKLGVAVFNALNPPTTNNQEMVDSKKEIDRAYELILDMAKNGDPQAQNAIASICMDKSLEMKDVSLLDEAEEWYEKSSAAGYARATQFLEYTWQGLKKEYKDRIINGENK